MLDGSNEPWPLLVTIWPGSETQLSVPCGKTTSTRSRVFVRKLDTVISTILLGSPARKVIATGSIFALIRLTGSGSGPTGVIVVPFGSGSGSSSIAGGGVSAIGFAPHL